MWYNVLIFFLPVLGLMLISAWAISKSKPIENRFKNLGVPTSFVTPIPQPKTYKEVLTNLKAAVIAVESHPEHQ